MSDRVPGRWASSRRVLFAMGVCLTNAQMTISLVSCSVGHVGHVQSAYNPHIWLNPRIWLARVVIAWRWRV